MSLLDELARQLASADASGSATGSGIGGSQDRAAQLGDLISSWIGTGIRGQRNA
jgi:hypothetical protein